MKGFQIELNKKSKKQLIPVVEALGLNFHKKKQEYIEFIINKIAEMFVKNRKAQIADDDTINQIERLISKKTREGAQFIRRCIKKIPEYERSDSNRRIYSKQIIKNLMIDKHCLCSSHIIPQNGLNVASCIFCKTPFHQSCFNIINKSQKFECPFCFSKTMDPLNQVQKTLFQGYLNMKQKIQKIEFSLTEQQLNKQGYEIQVRSIRLDGKNNYQLSWPDVGIIELNNNKLLELKPLVINSSLKRRKDEAKNIELKYVRKINNLVINFNSSTAYPINKYRISFNYIHFIGIFLVKPLKIQQLVQKILLKPISIEKSNSLLGSQFSQYKQVSVERVDINLTCAYSATAIKLPARGILCNHFKCFDLRNMVCAIASSRRWKCPICKERAHELIVDPLLSDIIKKNSQNKIKQISFQRDGEYKITYEIDKSDQESGNEQSNTNKKITNLINLDSQDEEEQINQNYKEERQWREQNQERERQERQERQMRQEDIQDNDNILKNNKQQKDKMELEYPDLQYEQAISQQSNQIQFNQFKELISKSNEIHAQNKLLPYVINNGENYINKNNVQEKQSQKNLQTPIITKNVTFFQQNVTKQFIFNNQKKSQLQVGEIRNNQQLINKTLETKEKESKKYDNKKVILPFSIQHKIPNQSNKKKPKQIKNRDLNPIVILDSDDQSDEYRQRKQINTEVGLIKELSRKFSQNIKFQQKDIFEFLALAQNFL